MSDILYELYNGDYEIGTYRDKEEERIFKEITPMMDKIKGEFGAEFADRLSVLHLDMRMRSNYLYYREGASMGIRLMAEVFTSATE